MKKPPKRKDKKEKATSKDKKGKKEKIHVFPTTYDFEPPFMVVEKLVKERKINWRKLQNISIQSLTSENYFAAIDFLKNQTVMEEVLCRLFDLKENWSCIKEMLDHSINMLENCTSLIAIEDVTKALRGTIIGRIISNDELLEEMEQLRLRALEKEQQKLRELAEPKNKEKSRGRKSATGAKLNEKGKKNKAKKKAEEKSEKKRSNEDEPRDTSLSRKTKTNIKPRLTVKIKQKSQKIEVVPKIEAPIDIIPVEECLPEKKPPILVFDDDYQIYQNEDLIEYMKFRHTLFNTVDVFSRYKVRCYYKIYIWAVDKKYEGQGIGSALLDAAAEMCSQLHIPVIISIFTSVRSQIIAEDFKYTKEYDLDYSILNKFHIQHEFNALLMAKLIKVPQITTYLRPEPVEEVQSKKDLGKKKKDKTKRSINKKN